MAHAPIYRATNERRKNASPIPWRRTATLASAAAALTMSGIWLGYGGVAGGSPRPEELSSAEPTAAERTVAVPVPALSMPIVDGGHPDIIGALSTALIRQFQVAQMPLLALSLGPLAPPVLAPPQPTAEPFVLPESLIPPMPKPIAEATAAPIDDGAAEAVVDDDAAAADLVLAPRVSQQFVAPVAALADEDVAGSTEALPDPRDQVAAEIQPEPTPAPPPPVPASAPAPVRQATPVVHRPTPEPAKPLERPRAPQIEVERHAPQPTRVDNSGPGKAQERENPPRPGDTRGDDRNDKGKSGGSKRG